MEIIEYSLTVPIHKIQDQIFIEKGIELYVLRLDLIHPITGGNKWFKLDLNLKEARENGFETLLSFGGPYSNHLAALAQAGKENGFNTIGIVRGEDVALKNKTLNRATEMGMQIHFVSREDYRKFRNDKDYTELTDRFGPCYIIPEGGSNILGVKGCMKIAEYIPDNIDAVFLPVGTGATLAGITAGMKNKSTVYGIAVVNADSFLENEVSRFLNDLKEDNDLKSERNHKLIHDYTFGGYAKHNQELQHFMDEFQLNQKMDIEPIYTGKLFFAVYDLVKNGFFEKGTRIMAIHTGGLQYIKES